MKTYLIIGILLLFSGSVQGQKYFKCIERQEIRQSFEKLVPLFKYEIFDKTDKVSIICYFTDDEYRDSFFNKALESVLPKDSINKLELRDLSEERKISKSLASLVIDITGKIQDITFIIPTKDRNILTDKVLYLLFQKFQETLIDMSKMEIDLKKDSKLYIEQTYPIYWWKKNEKKE